MIISGSADVLFDAVCSWTVVERGDSVTEHLAWHVIHRCIVLFQHFNSDCIWTSHKFTSGSHGFTTLFAENAVHNVVSFAVSLNQGNWSVFKTYVILSRHWLGVKCIWLIIWCCLHTRARYTLRGWWLWLDEEVVRSSFHFSFSSTPHSLCLSDYPSLTQTLHAVLLSSAPTRFPLSDCCSKRRLIQE